MVYHYRKGHHVENKRMTTGLFRGGHLTMSQFFKTTTWLYVLDPFAL